MTRPLIIGLSLTALVLASAHIRTGDALQAYAAKPSLSWRQAKIIEVRAKVHACQDELGVHRSPVAQKVITGGPRYRAWVLRRWRMRLDFCTDAVRDLNADPVKAIMAVFGPSYGPGAVNVSRCETGGTFSVYASNGRYKGLFQVSDHWRSTVPGFAYTPLAQARHAFAVFKLTGYSWAHWECKP